MDELLTTDEVAKRLKIHVITLRNWINDGRFPGAVKVGRHWRIPERHYRTFLKSPTGARREVATVKTTGRKSRK